MIEINAEAIETRYRWLMGNGSEAGHRRILGNP